MTIQEEVEFLRRQLREMQARQDGSTSQPAPPQTPPEDPRRFP
jgi:hypothetical protein